MVIIRIANKEENNVPSNSCCRYCHSFLIQKSKLLKILTLNLKKIIVTLGPASFSETIVKKLDNFGVDIFRINLSHTKINDYKGLVNKVLKRQEDIPDWLMNNKISKYLSDKINNNENIFVG
jgi:hypothetical protein